ncbi:hypothetical protein SAMN05192551_1149 [Tindallia magadiensis]|uniref:Replication-associated protein ORF2/G2P domain-containing protein n=1 Tax=Tindallia magadiensis TaxID=69895 RepID=A0A1I3HM07_9FIRM|nr:hypothetical protein [Tindallia magadiensis]SFI36639.1 hypothetical protein SAMN05192551_1149 [Tindallia magadiensis]
MPLMKLKHGRISAISMTYSHMNHSSKQGGYRPSKGITTGLYHQENYEQRQRIRRQTIQELIENNFDKTTSRFITLTFSNECLPPSIDHRPFKNFIKRIQYRYHYFRYVAIIEITNHENTSRWHYHVICNLPHIDHSELLSLWKCGAVNIQQVYDLEKLKSYFSKQFSQCQPSLKGKKAYFFSRGLVRHQVSRSWIEKEAEQFQKTTHELKCLKPSYLYSGENEYIGHFTYAKYKFPQPKYPVAGFAVRK